MDFVSSFFANLSEVFMTSTDTGFPHIDLLKVFSIAIISIVTYGVIIMRKIQTTQNDISKDKAEVSLYNSLKEQIDFLNNQVKEQAENLKLTIKQKDELFKEFTELRIETKTLQVEVNQLKNVQTENQMLKQRLNEKDLEIKTLREKNEKMVDDLFTELKKFNNKNE